MGGIWGTQQIIKTMEDVHHESVPDRTLFPADFQHARDVKSEPWLGPDDGVEKRVSLRDFYDEDYHLRAACVLLGPPGLNKTQLAEAWAADFAKRYVGGEERWYIKVGSVNALKPVRDYMRTGVPVILEEFGTTDKQQQRQAIQLTRRGAVTDAAPVKSQKQR